MTMLEKVARALAMSAGAAIVGPGQSRASREFGWKGDGVHLEQYVEAHCKEYLHAATFAISAMREPTAEMQDAGAMKLVGMGQVPFGAHIEVWREMIDAALEETTP